MIVIALVTYDTQKIFCTIVVIGSIALYITHERCFDFIVPWRLYRPG